jgi:hypothetical protein
MTSESRKQMRVDMLVAMAILPEPGLRDEVTDAMWADYGRMVHSRLMATDDLIATLNRAGLRSKSVKEYVGYIRTFILTGSRP